MPQPPQKEYILKRKKLSGIVYETALPNEYLVQVGKRDVKPILGGRSVRLFRKFIRVPASVQTLYFSTDNANVDYQGIGIDGFASWRINPENPALSIQTLDFFDEDDPMARTNNELRTICVEAVRHVISNMTIDEALKKKEDIANNLKTQLKEVEDKWGIIFDQVGIENVKIMSDKLFEELQSQYRDRLRLDVSRTRIDTDRKIATEENNMKEKTELESLETEKKLGLVRISNETQVRETGLEEERKVTEKEREIREETYRKDQEFKLEQEQKEYELSQLKKDLEIKLQKIEVERLETEKSIEELKGEISKKNLEIERLKREILQTFSPDALTSKFIEALPAIYDSIHIDNYSVLDSGSDGNISPVGKFMNELLFALKSGDVASLLKKKEEPEKE